MNYFHEVRDRKGGEVAAASAARGQGHEQQQHQHPAKQQPQHQPRPPRQNGGRHHQHHPHETAAVAAAVGPAWDLTAFLQRSLPGVGSADLARYEAGLREEGFGDGEQGSMLAFVKEGDLAHWKKAHARAFFAAVRQEIGVIDR